MDGCSPARRRRGAGVVWLALADGPCFRQITATVIFVARKDTVLVYIADPRWYITAEVDPGPPVRRWYRLWWDSIAHAHTGRQDPDELVAMIEDAQLDPLGWREPTVEESRPRRDG